RAGPPGSPLARPAAGSDRSRLPPPVQAVVAARLDCLSTTRRDLARRSSVFLDAFDLEELAFVEQTDGEALTALEDAEILTREDRPTRWRFRHQILHDVAYAGLSKRERLRLHLALADGLAAVNRPGVADHLERAAVA